MTPERSGDDRLTDPEIADLLAALDDEHRRTPPTCRSSPTSVRCTEPGSRPRSTTQRSTTGFLPAHPAPT